MADWWDVNAAQLQQEVRISEGGKRESYSEEDSRRAAVYSREDLIVLVSLLSSLNRQVSYIKLMLAVLTVVIACAAIRGSL